MRNREGHWLRLYLGQSSKSGSTAYFQVTTGSNSRKSTQQTKSILGLQARLCCIYVSYVILVFYQTQSNTSLIYTQTKVQKERTT